MSWNMSYDETEAKLEENRAMDFSNWSGQMVGRHLFAAGQVRMDGKHYDFPGYIRFPLKLYE